MFILGPNMSIYPILGITRILLEKKILFLLNPTFMKKAKILLANLEKTVLQTDKLTEGQTDRAEFTGPSGRAGGFRNHIYF